MKEYDPDSYEICMALALELARDGLGKVSPNPPVGAVLISKELQIAKGWHSEFGGPHAEVACINDAKSQGIDTQGATIFVTLEPCGHHGKTPPCAEAIIEAGITRVIYGHNDPHPVTRGKGPDQLLAAGIEVKSGILESECAKLLAPYLCHIRERRPLVTAKWAMTLDGRIASATGDSKWITSDSTRKWTRERRGDHNAILVGIGTVESDDPQLTARTPGVSDPLIIVLDPGGRISADRRLLNDGAPVMLVILEGQSVPSGLPESVEVLSIPGNPVENGKSVIDLKHLLLKLGERNIQSLLVEGGAVTIGHFFDTSCVDRCQVLIAPKVIGGALAPGPIAGKGLDLMTFAIEALDPKWSEFGPDRVLEASLTPIGRGRQSR